MKKCATCKIEKELDCFGKDKTTKSGYRSYCKECNRERANIRSKQIYNTKRKEYNTKNAKEISEKYKIWRLKNVKKISALSKKRYHNDINFRLKHILRSRIQRAIVLGSKKTSSSNLLGCNIEEYKQYLEKQFTEGMTWENYGRKEKHWVIDHIIPCSKFDLNQLEEQQKCFHYTNTQPLWWYDNLKKYNK